VIAPEKNRAPSRSKSSTEAKSGSISAAPETEKYAHVTYFFTAVLNSNRRGGNASWCIAESSPPNDLNGESAAGDLDTIVKAVEKGDFDGHRDEFRQCRHGRNYGKIGRLAITAV